MPYARFISKEKIKIAILGICSEYENVIKRGTYTYCQLSMIIMYLFSALEDVVFYHMRKLNPRDFREGEVKTAVMIRVVNQVGLLSKTSADCLSELIRVRNGIAHEFVFANRMLCETLKFMSAQECAQLFKNALNSMDFDIDTKIKCNELVYDLFRRDGLQVSDEFEQWMEAERAVLERAKRGE